MFITTTPRDNDVECFDQWSSTYERSWVQRVFFDPMHRATLALAARMVHQSKSVLLVDMSLPDWLVRVFHPRRVSSRAGLRALFNQAGLRVEMQQKVAWRGLLATAGKNRLQVVGNN
jgi:hypothetical protein